MKARMGGYELSRRDSAFLPPLARLTGQRLRRAPRVFRDRKDAGLRLADALGPCQSQDPLVLAIPRGGVEVGFYVALGLEAPLALPIVRKLPLPDQPEAGFGAVAEDGSTFIIEHLAAALGHDMVAQIIRQQQQEIRRRIEVLREGEPLPPLENRTVILVDDGIAMGSTARAAILMCRNQRAGRVLIASPVASASIADDLARIADGTVILETPIFLTAVAQVYENWYDVSDKEVIDIMNDYNRINQATS